MKIIAERLKLLRQQHGKSQATVSSDLGFSESNYQLYEYGKRIPAAKNLIQFADYYNVTTDYILGRTDKQN